MFWMPSPPLWHQIFLFPVSTCWATHFETVYRYCCFPLLPKTAHETYSSSFYDIRSVSISFNRVMFWEELQLWLRIGHSCCFHFFIICTLIQYFGCISCYEPLDYWPESGQDLPLWHKDNDIHHATANEIEIHYCK